MTIIMSVLLLWGLVEVLSGGAVLIWAIIEVIQQIFEDL